MISISMAEWYNNNCKGKLEQELVQDVSKVYGKLALNSHDCTGGCMKYLFKEGFLNYDLEVFEDSAMTTRR